MLRKLQIVAFFSFVVCTLLFSCCRLVKPTTGIFQQMNIPSDNPMSKDKIALGRKLFFDKSLSRDESISCATCHIPEYAFTDRKKVSNGVAGGLTERNSPSLLNIGYSPTLMADAHITSLEMQSIVPIQEHVEMDMKMGDLVKRLKNKYNKEAIKIFNREFDAFVITRALSAFERTLISNQSRFDDFYYKKKNNALNKDEIAGWKLFSEKLYCIQCHQLPFFTTYKAENNGLYADYGHDNGRFRIHTDSLDIGKFKVPTLRNIELSFPYMHDGSMQNLEEIIDHYAKGAARHWNQSKIIQPFEINELEKKQLVLFLKSLTDTSYMKDFK